MKKWRFRRFKCWFRVLMAVLFVAVLLAVSASVILLPFIIEKIYNVKPPSDFFNVKYEAKDILVYYGSLLSFFGTVFLGGLTIYQNKKAQEKSDEVNRLQLELQKKSMAMAEAEYLKNENAYNAEIIPKFEISLSGYSGNYADMCLKIKNVTASIVTNIAPISLEIKDEKDKEIAMIEEFHLKKRSLGSEQEMELKINTPALIKRENNYSPVTYYENVKFILNFSCEDKRGNTHYFRATLKVLSTKDFCEDFWDLQKVG